MQRTLQQVSLLMRRARGRAAALALAAALAPLGACTQYVEPAWETGTLAVTNGQLHYEVVGSGEPLVFVHDFSLDRRMWEDQLQAFSARYRVIRYDARGFGRSSGIDLETGKYLPSDDLRALLDFLGMPRVRVVGAGMGARYALDFVLANSDRVRAMVLSEPLIYLGQTDGAFTDALNPAKLAAVNNDMGTAKRAWFDSRIFAPARRQAVVERHLQRMLDDYTGWHFTAGPNAGEDSLPTGPAYLQLNKVAVATLLLVGQFDISDVLESAQALQEGVVNARIQKLELPGVGHFPNMEAPDDFNRSVLEFFDQPEQQNAGAPVLPDAG